MPYPIAGEYEYKSLAPTAEDIKAKATRVLITVPGWDSLEDNSLEEISEKAIVENFSKGEIIIKEGSQLLGLYVIIEGKVELSLSDQDGYKKVLGHLAQGEIFGEKASLLSGQLSDVNVKALEDIEVLRVDITTLQHLLQDNPILASKLGEMMELRRKSVKAHFETV
jgi:acetate kinase